jgi:hypothetical protein
MVTFMSDKLEDIRIINLANNIVITANQVGRAETLPILKAIVDGFMKANTLAAEPTPPPPPADYNLDSMSAVQLCT